MIYNSKWHLKIESPGWEQSAISWKSIFFSQSCQSVLLLLDFSAAAEHYWRRLFLKKTLCLKTFKNALQFKYHNWKRKIQSSSIITPNLGKPNVRWVSKLLRNNCEIQNVSWSEFFNRYLQILSKGSIIFLAMNFTLWWPHLLIRKRNSTRLVDKGQ